MKKRNRKNNKFFYFKKPQKFINEIDNSNNVNFSNEILLKNGFNWKKNDQSSAEGKKEEDMYDLSLSSLEKANKDDICIHLKKNESYTKKFTIFLYYASQLYDDIYGSKNFIVLKNRNNNKIKLEMNVHDKCLNYFYYQCRLYNNFFFSF